MKKIFLTSAICMAFAAPAMADIAANASSATCDTNVLGTGSGSATLEAKWTANTYSCEDGQYLRASDATCQTCPAGSYCNWSWGTGERTFDGSDLGLYSCTDGDVLNMGFSSDGGPYPLSDAGATEYSQCYTNVTATCSEINPYTGGHGTANYANATAGARKYVAYESMYLNNLPDCAITSLTCDTGYSQGTAGALANYAYGELHFSHIDFRYKELNGSTGGDNASSLSAGEWETKFSDNTTVHGMAKCSSTNGTSGQTGTPSNTSGQYCWCEMTGYNIKGGQLQSIASPSWVYVESGSDDCTNECAYTCSDWVNYDNRRALFGDAGANMACEANTINLDWDPKNGGAHTTNSCTYDGAITMPAAPEKTGYTFNGWKLK